MNVSIDRAGRIVVPKSIRDSLGLAEGADLEIFVEDGRLVIEVPNPPKRLEKRGDSLVIVADEPIGEMTTAQVRDILESVRR
ncbi:MAG: AbrB/MazE/SpoVT family DNA-binding domain-containing protein [Acidobacteria bacterium]|nr:AbrB/MazE/SpoVT family DNA-binding domain-containing protein [Acidobacteriota bacterium]